MRALLDLVMPMRCAGCGAPATAACPACRAALTGPAALRLPDPAPAGLPAPYAVTTYAGPARALLLAYKEDGVTTLRPLLAAALATSAGRALRAAGTPSGWLVPVPSSGAALSTRGRDVVGELARLAARRLRSAGFDVEVLPALRHVRRVADSAGLGAAARSVNLAGAFTVPVRARRTLAQRPVVIVDDVMTTGVTLRECARAVQAAGGVCSVAAVVAATARRR